MGLYEHKTSNWRFDIQLGYVYESLTDEEEEEFNIKIRKELGTDYRDIELLLKESMLDIPELDYEKIYKYIWSSVCSCKDYIISQTEELREDEVETKEQEIQMYALGEYYYEYFEGEYLKELRELFADYIVK